MIDRIVTVRDGEAATAVMMFAYSFLAMTAYNILKPITRSQFISALGADNLPYVQLGAGLLIGILMQWYSKGAALLPRRLVIPVTLGAEAVVLIVFWVLFSVGTEWVSVAFYVLALILGILLTSQFWTLASDLYDARQAKRLFGFIGGGASLGGATGAGITSLVVHELGTTNLLLVSAAILGACALLVAAIVRREPVTGNVSVAEERSVGGGEALRLLRSSRHLQMIAIVIGCAAIGAAILEQQLNMAAESVHGSSTDAITAFLARITFFLSIGGFLIQVVLTSRIHRSLGLAVALLILPVSLGVSSALILWTGALWAAGAARVLDSSLRYTIDKTTREVLFLPLPADLKYRAKPFVDVTVDRSAKALGALLVLVLIKPWGFHIGWQGLSAASLVVTGIWIVMAMRARREYMMAFRHNIQTRTIEADGLQLDVTDASTIELLVEELAHPDASRVLYAIDMLEMLGKRNLVTPLLLHHESGAVRARTLAALESASSVTERWTPMIHRMLKDRAPGVRATALQALAVLHKNDASRLLRKHVHDSEPRIAVTAAVLLADSDTDADVCAGEAALTTLVEDVSPAVRREIAAVLAHVKNARCRALLVPLIHDLDSEVARVAIRSAHMLTPADILLVPALIARLGHRVLKPVAREALSTYGDHGCEVLAHVLSDAQENRWIRRHVPGTLARIPTQRSLDILLGASADPDGFVRFKALAAVERLHRQHAHLLVNRETVERRLIEDVKKYHGVLTLRFNLGRHDQPSERSLLERALDDKLRRITDRIFRLLGLIQPWKEVEAARSALGHRKFPQGPHDGITNDRRAAVAAVEYFDNIVSHSLRKWLMPILDDMPMAERVRIANTLLRTRPRDLEDTVAQLVHDDDRVISAAAIQFVWKRRMSALIHDLEYVRDHARIDDALVSNSASWALDTWSSPDVPVLPLPIIEVVDRLRRIPLFERLSVDEMVRIANLGSQLTYSSGDTILNEGVTAEHVVCLLDGPVSLATGQVYRELRAPAVLAFDEMLERQQLRETVVALDHAACLALPAEEFLAMISDDIQVVQGLFRTLLGSADERHHVPVHSAPRTVALAHRHTGSLKPLEKLFVLEQNPLLAGTTVSHLLDMAGIAREVTLERATTLFHETDVPAVYYVLSGIVRLERTDLHATDARPGATIGMSAVLAGMPAGWRATVMEDGYALCIEREDLIDLLAEEVELLRYLASATLHTAPMTPMRESGSVKVA